MITIKINANLQYSDIMNQDIDTICSSHERGHVVFDFSIFDVNKLIQIKAFLDRHQ
jgi:hypothetical protein